MSSLSKLRSWSSPPGAVNVSCRQGRRTLGFEKGLKGRAGNFVAWLGGLEITGHQEICGVGLLKLAWVPDRWIIRKFRLVGN